MTKIKVYSTPTCPYCTIAKKYFDDNGVKYDEVDVSLDEKQAEEMQQKSGQMGVPVIIINSEDKEDVIVGFDKNKIDQILKLK